MSLYHGKGDGRAKKNRKRTKKEPKRTHRTRKEGDGKEKRTIYSR